MLYTLFCIFLYIILIKNIMLKTWKLLSSVNLYTFNFRFGHVTNLHVHVRILHKSNTLNMFHNFWDGKIFHFFKTARGRLQNLFIETSGFDQKERSHWSHVCVRNVT